MKRRQSIQTKLFCAFGLVFAIAAGNSVYSWITVGKIRNDVAQEIAASARLVDQADQVMTGIANMRSAMRGVSLFAAQQHPDQIAKARAAFDAMAAEMDKTVQAMETGAANPADRETVTAIRSALDQWRGNFPEFVDLNVSGHADEATAITLKKTSPVMDLLQKNAAELGRVLLQQVHHRRCLL